MNFNANRPAGPARKIKRVSDVNAMGAPMASNPYMTDPFAAPQPSFGPGAGPNPNANFQSPAFNAAPQFPAPNHPQHQQQQQQPQTVYPDFNAATSPQSNNIPQYPPMLNPTQAIPGFGMFQQPIVQSMAMEYGQQLADQGKQMMESQFEKYIPVTRLKYYFAVDNKYVINKLRLLFFPFTHSNWALSYDQENPVQPRYDLNAPDLYIPTMAYITYIVLAGFILGMQQKFSPEDLGKLASTALAVVLFELVVYSLALYITNIPTSLKTLDLLAYSGYKFTLMVTCILVGIVFNGLGYWAALVYCGATLAFFMTRTLYSKLKSASPQANQQQHHQHQQPTYDAYGVLIQQPSAHHQDYTAARKRKVYFTGMFVCVQLLVTWWLTRNLIAPTGVPLSAAL